MKTFDPSKYLIFKGLVGSRLYGIETEESDFDYRSVCVPPLSVTLDLFNKFEVKDSGFENDEAIYTLAKFLQMCTNANPSILEFLFVPASARLVSSEWWDMVLNNKNLLLSKKVKHTFSGYSIAQLKKLKSHRTWFLNPPSNKPSRQQYGLRDDPTLSYTQMTALATINPQFVDTAIREEIIKEKNYREAKKTWDNYVSWKENRNPKRRALEESYGYDTKWAAHIFRLMSEGKELLLTGNITFPLPNADEIREVRNGKYTYDELLSAVEVMEQDFETWYSLSSLPHHPDVHGINSLYQNITLNYP